MKKNKEQPNKVKLKSNILDLYGNLHILLEGKNVRDNLGSFKILKTICGSRIVYMSFYNLSKDGKINDVVMPVSITHEQWDTDSFECKVLKYEIFY